MVVDTIFKNAELYNVFLKEWSITDIAVLKGRILFIGNTISAGLSSDNIIECENKPLIPGLIDIHLHIESSLCTPEVFAETLLPLGITTVVSEPHEIANVFGLPGIEEMIRASKDTVIDIFYGVPSSVPSTTAKMETTGGSVSSRDLEILMRKYPEVICLGEVMSYRSLINDFYNISSGNMESKTIDLLKTLKKNHPTAAVEGHCPSITGLDLAKVLYFGVDSDHCLQDIEGMKQRFANGMFVELQEKSITPEIIKYLQNNNTDGLYSFVTDDVPPDILINKGHLDYIARKAMKEGLSLEKIITATSLAPSTRMGFRDRGIIAPGKIADLIILEDHSTNFRIHSVFKKGIIAAQILKRKGLYTFGSDFMDSIKISASSIPDSIYSVPIPKETIGKSNIKCRIMRKNKHNTYTTAEVRAIPVSGNTVNWTEPNLNLNLVIVIERYSGELQIAQGFLDGICIKNGAFCSSHAHDHHNILLVGDNITDMKKALNWVITEKGGMCVVSNNKNLAAVNLKIGGILSDSPMEKLSKEVIEIQANLKLLGIDHINPIMSLCTLTLPVSPQLKITDKGIIDTIKSEIVPLFIN